MRIVLVLLTLLASVASHAQVVTLSLDDMRAHSAFRVPSIVMEPTIKSGEFVYVDVKGFQAADLKVGNIIAFRQRLPVNQLTVKRVIALPGSTVQFRRWKLYVDNKEAIEPYVHPDNVMNTDSFEWGPVTVKAGCVFVLSDNRDIGNDSRKNGCVVFEDILGVAKFVATESAPQAARRLP